MTLANIANELAHGLPYRKLNLLRGMPEEVRAAHLSDLLVAATTSAEPKCRELIEQAARLNEAMQPYVRIRFKVSHEKPQSPRAALAGLMFLARTNHSSISDFTLDRGGLLGESYTRTLVLNCHRVLARGQNRRAA